MKKKLAIFFLVILIIGVIIIIPRNVESKPTKNYQGSVYSLSSVDAGSYGEYLTKYEDFFPNHTIEIDPLDYVDFTNQLFDELPHEEEVLDEVGLYIPETGDIAWEVDVLEAGFYNITIEYFAPPGRSSEISRGLMINGNYPFTEVTNFKLSRIWEDEFDVSSRHTPGKHDLKPKQIEKARWVTESIRDRSGYYGGDSYKFYFEKGINEIRFIQDREPIIIKKITLHQPEEIKSYSEVKELYNQNNYKVIGTANFDSSYKKIQGESAYEKSTPILAPVANWSSYKVDPYEKFITRYNTIGGVTWRVPGDWISWEVEIEEAGLYELTFKVLQNYDRGVYSSRRLYINGKIPFSEARNILFAYSSDWQNVTLGNENENYLFYLEEGKNVITLEATIGIYGTAIRLVEEVIANLNELYRKIVMITGVTPGEYQDYMLAKRIPNLYEMIDDAINNLEGAKEEIIIISGERSQMIASLERTLHQLRRFKVSELEITGGIKELDDNIAALGTWVMNISEQSLAVDSIFVHGSEVELPKASTNFFQKIWHEIIMLIGSYGANTSLESSVEVEGPTIQVWIASGRDQSQLLRQLIDESFTIDKNINVELKLVSQTALLPATLSGNGPDVAIGVAQNIPVNWGIRNAVLDLTEFSDFEEVSGWFHESALTSFTFDGSVYALPDTQDFLVSFIRTDIAEELEVIAPTTWDEVIDTLPVLQRQYLDYYIPNTRGNLSTVMYAMVVQNGGSLYSEDSSETLLTEKNATDAFIKFTKFFSEYGFEVSADFPNRFRSGEMPMGIYNYSLYNTLSVFAPEINGRWEFGLIPGFEDEEGNINNQSTATVSGSVIIAATKEKEASWEFLKWWLSADTQSAYGRGMEAILGAAARYPTANLEAFKRLPWSTKEYLTLEAQREIAVGVPIVPGDYIVGRYIDNAFRSSINRGVNPRESLYDYTEKINIELARKRKEFDLD